MILAMERALFAVAVVAVAGFIIFSAPAAQSDTLKKFASYEELKSFVKTSAEDYSAYSSMGLSQPRSALASQEAAPASAQAGADSLKSADYSGTNVQVAGVDESDIVKSDGKYIYAISGNKVMIIEAYPAESAKIVSEINLNETQLHNIFINGDRLIVFGNSYNFIRPLPAEGDVKIGFAASSQSFFINVYDVSDRSSPTLVKNITAEGYYSNSRMIGEHVYVVVNQPVYYYYNEIPLPVISGGAEFPDIYYFDVPDNSYNFINIIALNVNSGEAANKAFMLPSSENIFVSEKNIYLTHTRWLDYRHFYDRFVDEVVVTSIPSISGRISEIKSYNISKSAKLIEIEQTMREHLAGLNPEEAANVYKSLQEKAQAFQASIAKERERTIISKISVSGLEINYNSQGSVPGTVLNQFSMDEHDGYFRIATTTNNFGPVIMPAGVGVARSGAPVADDVSTESAQETNQEMIDKPTVDETATETVTEPSVPSPTIVEPPVQREQSNNVYVLDASMNVAGKLEDLAPGERIYSARFMGKRAYLVTFKQIDPLFVIDLSETSPKVLGFLKVTGVSQYIHPIDDSHIIGIGKEASEEGTFQGLKMSLFDVSDVANPKEISKFTIGDRGTDSQVFYDHKAFLYSPGKKLLVLPVMVAEIDRSKFQENPAWAYGEPKWQGAYVFSVDESGFKVSGRITHALPENEKFYGQYSVMRSLYIEDVLYTVSNKLLKANSLESLDEIKSIELPGDNYPYFVY